MDFRASNLQCSTISSWVLLAYFGQIIHVVFRGLTMCPFRVFVLPPLSKRHTEHWNYAILMTIKLLIRNKKVLDVTIVIHSLAFDSAWDLTKWWMGKLSQMSLKKDFPSSWVAKIEFHSSWKLCAMWKLFSFSAKIHTATSIWYQLTGRRQTSD